MTLSLSSITGVFLPRQPARPPTPAVAILPLMSPDSLLLALYIVPPLLVSVVVHEVAHGYAALLQGDPTAKNEGRLSFNPIVHIDFFLTILVPGILIISGSPFIFGGAKPVPVDGRYFRNPRQSMLIVAAAGPLSNVVLALICLLVIWVIPTGFTFFGFADLFMAWLVYGFLINIVLAVFNMLPVPPLDGGRIVTSLLPLRYAIPYARLEPFGLLIVVLLIFSGLTGAVLGPIVRFAMDLL